MSRIFPYLQLLRPANLFTAVADVAAGAALAGWAIAGHGAWPLGCLALASALLYGGGVVLNDVFDASLDRQERPERPIPSGRVSLRAAACWGAALLAAGVLLAFLQGVRSGVLALLIAAAALVYDAWAKHQHVLGPLTMGLCRGLNLALGMSILGGGLEAQGWLCAAPLVYIAAITLISRGEVHGGSRAALRTAAVLYAGVMALVAWKALDGGGLALTLPFLLLFAGMIVPPLVRAMKDPSGPRIGQAVKAGVLALILLDAAWVATGASWPEAVATALLLPLSLLVARFFAVT